MAVIAIDCIKCRHCNSRCPFQTAQQERMEEIKKTLAEVKELEFINVKQTVRIPKICQNCLYGGGFRCGNANNKEKIILYDNRPCEHFWLDQHRFPDAETNR